MALTEEKRQEILTCTNLAEYRRVANHIPFSQLDLETVTHLNSLTKKEDWGDVQNPSDPRSAFDGSL